MVIRRLIAGLSHACLYLAALGAALMAVLISYVVVQRFFWHQTPHWAEELPRFILVWSAFLGGVACTYRRSHLTAGLLSTILPPGALQNFVRKVGDVAMIFGLAVLGYAGWELSELTMGQPLPAIGVDAGFVYLALPVACAAMVIVQLGQLFGLVSDEAKES